MITRHLRPLHANGESKNLTCRPVADAFAMLWTHSSSHFVLRRIQFQVLFACSVGSNEPDKSREVARSTALRREDAGVREVPSATTNAQSHCAKINCCAKSSVGMGGRATPRELVSPIYGVLPCPHTEFQAARLLRRLKSWRRSIGVVASFGSGFYYPSDGSRAGLIFLFCSSFGVDLAKMISL